MDLQYDMATTNVSVSIGIVPRVDGLEGRDVYVPKYISFHENCPEKVAALVKITYMHTKALMETYSYNKEELRMLNVHVPSKSYMRAHAGTYTSTFDSRGRIDNFPTFTQKENTKFASFDHMSYERKLDMESPYIGLKWRRCR